VQTTERAALEINSAPPNPADGCPPDFLVRAAVLETDEPVLSHIARCGHCMNIYMGALGNDWHHGHRPQ
jgi:hypothetical protein